MNEIWELDLKTFKWILIQDNLVKEDSYKPTEGRAGHTASAYKNKIIFFGGERSYNEHLKIRLCYTDFMAYNIEKKNWT